jgi:hypothetical protein
LFQYIYEYLEQEYQEYSSCAVICILFQYLETHDVLVLALVHNRCAAVLLLAVLALLNELLFHGHRDQMKSEFVFILKVL